MNNPIYKVTQPAELTSTLCLPYLLVQGSTPIYRTPDGVKWLDRLWAKDVQEHAKVCTDLRIASPLVDIEKAGNDHIEIAATEFLQNVNFIELPNQKSTLKAILQIVNTAKVIWSELHAVAIVHYGVAGWPYPLGWLVWPLAKIKSIPTAVVVESAPWRLREGANVNIVSMVRARIYEAMAKKIVRNSTIRFFTTQKYLQELCSDSVEHAHVVEATWIDAENIIDSAQAQKRTHELGSRSIVRCAFFGRLSEEKGVLILLDAIKGLDKNGRSLALDVYGEGPLKHSVLDRVGVTYLECVVKYCGTRQYGSELFEAISGYDFLIVPSLGDEQPRIVYDAYARGVPVIASDTSGLRQCVIDGETGLLFQAGSSSSLTECLNVVKAWPMDQATLMREEFQANCLAMAGTKTHAAMHQKRVKKILEVL